MKRLLLMRHAPALSTPGIDDHDRPLEEKSHDLAQKVGRLLYQEGMTPEKILCSSSLRTTQTAEGVAEGSRYNGEIKSSRKLYLAGINTCIEWIRTTESEVQQLLLIGHNPAIPELIDALTGTAVDMVPATLTRLFVPIDQWSELDEDIISRLSRTWAPADLPLGL